MSPPANVRALERALSVVQERIKTETDPEALRVLLEYQERLLGQLNDLPFSQLGTPVRL